MAMEMHTYAIPHIRNWTVPLGQWEHMKIGPDLLCVLGRGRRYLLCSMSNWKPTLSRICDSSMCPHPPLVSTLHYYLPPCPRADMLLLALEDT